MVVQKQVISSGVVHLVAVCRHNQLTSRSIKAIQEMRKMTASESSCLTHRAIVGNNVEGTSHRMEHCT